MIKLDSLPVTLCKRIMNANFLLELNKFLVRAEQITWICLVHSLHSQDVHVILVRIVPFLYIVHFYTSQSALLSHPRQYNKFYLYKTVNYIY